MSYQPQPGTIAFRAIAWLEKQPAGHELTLSVWAEAIDVEPSTLGPCIAPAVEAGLLRKRTKDGMQRPFWFSLGDGKPLPVVDEEERREPIQPRTAPEIQPRPGQLLPGVRGDEPVPPAPPLKVPEFTEHAAADQGRPMTLRECADAEERPPSPRPFDCWLSGVSGELVLQGLAVDADGDAVLPPEWVAAVRRVLFGAVA